MIMKLMSAPHKPLDALAREVAEALVRVSVNDRAARVSTPLLFPGGSRVGVDIAPHKNGFLVSDMGSAMREAELLGGERQFSRIAPDVAQRYGVRFDHQMFFDLEVPEAEIMHAIIAISNAAKSAVEATMMQLASREAVDLRSILWTRLDQLFVGTHIERGGSVLGSSDKWQFDAVVHRRDHITLFEIIAPHANAVSSAVTKFLDIRDLGTGAPKRVAVLSDKERTPHIAVLARTARIIRQNDPDEVFLNAA